MDILVFVAATADVELTPPNPKLVVFIAAVARGFAAGNAELLTNGDAAAVAGGGVVCDVAQRLPLAALAVVVVVVTVLVDIEGGPPNPIEAKTSSSVAPIKVFFLGLAATVGFFFGPRLVMPMVIPPTVAGMVVTEVLAVTGGGVIVVMVDAGGVNEEEAEMAAIGIPLDAPPPIPSLVKLMPVATPLVLHTLLPLVFLDMFSAWKLEGLRGVGFGVFDEMTTVLRKGAITAASILSESKEGLLWVMFLSL